MYWPINHMVADKESAVTCNECHTRNNSRLAGINDFYLPGRDYSAPIDIAGKWMLILTILGIFIHTVIRILSQRKFKSGVIK